MLKLTLNGSDCAKPKKSSIVFTFITRPAAPAIKPQTAKAIATSFAFQPPPFVAIGRPSSGVIIVKYDPIPRPNYAA